MRHRISAGILVLLTVLGWQLRGESEDEALQLPPWMVDATMSLGYGYKENVLLSEVESSDSAFSYVELDAMAARLFEKTGGEALFMFLGDTRLMSDIEELSHETFAVLTGEYAHPVSAFDKLSLGFEAVYLRQAFDASLDFDEIQSEIIESHNPKAFLKWDTFVGDFQLQLQAARGRTYFANREDDYDTTEFKLAIDKQLAERLKARLKYSYYDRSYTDLQARDAEGFRLDDTLLSLSGQKLSLSLEQGFNVADWEGKWSLAGSLREKRDDFFGYSDRDGWLASTKLGLSREHWRLKAKAGYGERDYPIRLGGDDLPRFDERFFWGLEIERNLGENWSVFIVAEGEEEDTNADFSSYESKSFTIGLRLPDYSR